MLVTFEGLDGSGKTTVWEAIAERYPDAVATREPTPRSLASFLVSRYRFYVADDAGTIYYADIDHDPWPLQEGTAEIRDNDLFAANGFDRPKGDPVVYYSPGIDVTAGRLRRL